MSKPDFHTDKAAVRRSFDRAAAHYDGAALLQRGVADRMLERLDLVRLKPEWVLDAGSGTGYAAPKLAQRYAGSGLIELDLALSMLQVSARRDGRIQRWLGRTPHRVCADLEALPLAAQSMDLIWSNLAIQWLNEPDLAFQECHRVLRPEGLLMFSSFGPDTLFELRRAFAQADDAPHVNRFLDMHDLGDALVRQGFADPVVDVDRIVLTYADVRAVMHDLKSIGAHSAAQGRRRGLLGKSAFARMVAAYEQLRKDGRLPATYEVVYGHAWKPAPRPARSSHSQVIEFRPRPAS